ncbi:MAG TPA: hypothetical protein VFA22_11685 [Stellaceae bacterium]|nr:hypothetical protein [Stellaceae bacterium]
MTIATRVGNTFIGSPVERIEDLRFVRGRGEYVDDIVRDGMLHAAIVRSPVAHGRIRAIDTRAALAMPGVRGVLTAKEIGDPVPVIPLRQEHSFPLLEHFLQPVIAADRVRFVGEPVAIVVADTPSLAEDAADAVRSRSTRCRRRPTAMPRRATRRCCSRRAAPTACWC